MNIVDAALAAVDPLNNMNPTVVNRADQAAEVAQYLYDNFGADIISIYISKHSKASEIHVVEHPPGAQRRFRAVARHGQGRLPQVRLPRLETLRAACYPLTSRYTNLFPCCRLGQGCQIGRRERHHGGRRARPPRCAGRARHAGAVPGNTRYPTPPLHLNLKRVLVGLSDPSFAFEPETRVGRPRLALHHTALNNQSPHPGNGLRHRRGIRAVESAPGQRHKRV